MGKSNSFTVRRSAAAQTHGSALLPIVAAVCAAFCVPVYA